VRPRNALLVVAFLALSLSAASPAAEHAFPGRNGLIVFASRMDFTYDQIIHNVGSWEIYTTDAQGHFTRLTHNRVEDLEPRWSPDARRIVFVRSCCGSRVRARHIYVMNANGTRARNISGGHNDDRPSWSPSGRRIAFANGGALWVMSPDGSHRRKVLTAKGNPIAETGYAPVWSHDGKEIDFLGVDPDVFDTPPAGVFGVDVDTGAVRRLFKEQLSQIEWSPDGKRMLMFDRRGLEIARADATHRKLLKRRGESVFRCTWSPDGRRLACIEHFAHEEDVELTLLNLDATAMVRLTNNTADEEPWPDWGRAR
jgi:Tol biopolymer transport system component